MAVGSPTGFVGVFGRGLPIGFDQLRENRGKEMGHPVKAFYEASRISLQLFTDASQRNPVQIVHRRRIGHQLVTIEVLGEHAGGRRLEDSPTLGTIAFGKPIEQRFSPKRTTFHDESFGVTFIHEGRATLRATISRGRDHRSQVLSLDETGSWTSSSKVSGTSPFGFASLLVRPIRFEGDLGRGR